MDRNIKINMAFICGIFPEEQEEYIIKNSIGNIQNASNELQKAYINGMEEAFSTAIKLINAPFIGSFPKRYKKLRIKKSKFSHTQGAGDISVGFCNLSGINYFSKAHNLAREAKKWAQENSNNNINILMAYSITYPMVYALKEAKKTNPNLITCLIAPDLPQYMTFAKHSRIWHYIANKVLILPTLKKLYAVDSYIVLTKYFEEKIPIGNKPYIVIEGMFNYKKEISDLKTDSYNKYSKNRILMYMGSLEYEYGVMEMISGFIKTNNQSYELWICGSGNCQEEVRKASIDDKRIKYLGQVTHQEAILLQQQADVLINPRSSLVGDYTKYSFPSKTIEYMASGKPVLLKKLPGIPDEYYEYVFVIPDGSITEIQNSIERVLSLPIDELERVGKVGKEYIMNTKNSFKQCEKVRKMLIDHYEKINGKTNLKF